MKKETKAVSLRYPENLAAPLITASEKGRLAERLQTIAKENNIPIIKDDNLVEVLSSVEIGKCIPVETYRAVATIFAFIFDMDNK